MLGSSSPFPWWLWLLAGLWATSLALRRKARISTDWQRGIDLLIGVYTILLIYSTIRCAVPAGRSPGAVGLDQLVEFWSGAVLAVVGGLLTFSAGSSSFARWGHVAGMAGIATLAMRWQAYELASLCLLVCIASALPRGSTDVNFSVNVGSARRETWIIAAATMLVCVIWLGLVQYAFRVELQRPGPSRWYTAIPSPASAARARRSEILPASSAMLTWSGIALAGTLVWTVWQHRQSAAANLVAQETATTSLDLTRAS